MRLFAFALLLIAFPAFAGDLVVRDKDAGAELRIMDSPCTHAGTLGLLREEWRGKFKNARVLVDGRIVAYGCWILKDDMAVVVLEDGSVSPVPMRAFSDPTI